jgi:periplasmic protein TonB
MRVRGGILAVVCAGVALAGARVVRAQEATSAQLPDQFQTGAMTSHSKSKKKKAERNSQTLATAPKQNTPPPPQQTPPVQELPPVLTTEEKKAEPSQAVEAKTLSLTPAHVTKSAAPPEESVPAIAPVERKPRSKRRSRPPVQSEAASIPAPVPMSLSVAQSMAISAPLPEYPYEAKRRHLTGNGVCVLTVDTATGKVTDATMSESTGSRFLDKFTVQTFKDWRFKPGTVSQLRVPISYE